jgi:cyclic pyranopterin phosphate synthase
MSAEKQFSHLSADGEASMVDVSEKPPTRRVARASCRVLVREEVLARLSELPKGDALATARIAGIQAAKRTDEWIPLAHPLALDQIGVEFDTRSDGLTVVAEVVCTARTGAEMEALVACAAAALTVYDMVKSLQKDVVVTDLQLDFKSGGRSGEYRRSEAAPDP